MSSKADVESFEKLADRFEHLIQEEPDLSVEEAKKTIIRLGAMGARLWHRSGIELIKGFSPDRFNPKITHDSFKDEKLWWLTWQALVNVLATAYPHRIPGGVALSAGDVKLDEPGQDIPAYEINLPWERWKSLAQDFAGCCRLIDELLHEKTKTSHSPDFTSVMWFGTSYRFTKGHQAQVIKLLWEEWERGRHSLSQEYIGEQIGGKLDNFEIRWVFRKRVKGKYKHHPAWNKMIKQVTKGSYALVEPEKIA